MTTIERRSQWGALSPKNNPGGFSDLRATVAHYTGAGYGYMVPRSGDHENCRRQVRAIQRQHLAIHDQSDIEYVALACSHGTLFEGRVLGYKGGANGTADSNKTMPSVCFLVGVGDQPSPEMFEAAAWFHQRVEARAGHRLDMLPHSAIFNTGCPGPIIFNWLDNEAYRRNTPAPTPTPIPGDDDMPAPDVVQLNSVSADGQLPAGAVVIASPDMQTHRWVKDEDELNQLRMTFARRGWAFPDPIPPIPGWWTKQYGVLIGPTP